MNQRTNIILVSCAVLLSACGSESVPPSSQPAIRKELVKVDPNSVWRDEYGAVETDALNKSQNGDLSEENIDTLSKLASVHYNSAIASLYQMDVHKEIQKGEVVARIAMQSYLKSKLPRDTREYTDLLHRLALLEEKLGDFALGAHMMQELFNTPVHPPYSEEETFALRMDLGRMYLGARNDSAAEKLFDELLAELNKKPDITDSKLIFYESWLRAKERVNASEEEIKPVKKLAKKLRKVREAELERETDEAVKAEESGH